MNRVQKAVQLFNSNYNCSQAVLAAFADKAGLDEPTALKLASGFGGGIGCSGGTCGAFDRCDDFVRIAAEILEEMLNMQER